MTDPIPTAAEIRAANAWVTPALSEARAVLARLKKAAQEVKP